MASFSTASAACTGTHSTNRAGGLVGLSQSTVASGAIVASYATGAVTGACPASAKLGLVHGGTVESSYWDVDTSRIADDEGTAAPEGRTTTALQTPTSAIGIYAGWDRLDLGGDSEAAESPWDFGTSSQYPVLSYRGMDVIAQRGDYDLDDDGLIDIRTLAQLNAVRWDLDGDGAPSSGNVGNYGRAFRHHDADMGCPANCTGYELENDLDFDTDGDGSTHTGGTSDSGDAYHNGGSGWDPIGPASTASDSTHFNTVFSGDGHVVRNLFVSRARDYAGLFAATASGATVRSLGMADAYVDADDYAGAVSGENAGRIAAVWTSGSASGDSHVGGLAGSATAASTIVASYSTASVECTGSAATDLAGGLAGANAGTIAASYSTGAVTGACPTANKHGLAGGSGTFTASYWDVNRSSISDDSDNNPPEGETSNNLRTPTGYTGIYALWDDQDVDGDSVAGETPDDDAWDFGQFQWPVLKFGGLDAAPQIALQPSTAPTFGAGTVPNKTFRRNFPIPAFQVPAASGGDGPLSYSATGLPAGLSFGAPNCAARTVCGTPTGAATVTIHAHDADGDRSASDRAELAFTITLVEPTAAITATTPATLTEAALNGAEVTVTLTDTTFASGVTAADFTLNTDVSGLAVGTLAAVTAGDTSATFTLAYDDTDFDTARTLGVTVAASAHALEGALASATVNVMPSLEAAVTPPTLALNEATGSNTGTFTAVLDSAPAATTTVAVASADTGAATVSVAALTFTTQNWNTAQAVTVTAQADDDPNNESTTVTLSAAGVGVLATVAVTVTDDDRGTVLIDADATTAAQDPGPVLVVEDLVGSFERSYTVRLSAQPTANATVAVASSDAPAARATRGTACGHAVVSALTFTTQNWNSPQTVWATAIGDSDAVDESVTITHAATGGGYGGTTTRLRVGVSDDERTGTDYDTDEDGLIEISTLAQLNAVRWDLDGNGAPASNAADYHGASGAFANASTGMGCPTGGCSGYELAQDLDFDTDGDGSTHTSGTSDAEDAWHNGGNGWDPIGPSVATTYEERLRRIREESFNAVFDGNGHSIHNLFINRGRDWAALFSGVRADGVVRSLGLPNAYVDGGASGSVATLAGTLWGRVEAAWATGAVAGGTNVAGLVGVDERRFHHRRQLLDGVGGLRHGRRRRPRRPQRGRDRRQLRDRRGDRQRLPDAEQARPGGRHRHGDGQPLGSGGERRHGLRAGQRAHHGAAARPYHGHRHLRRLGGPGRGRRRRPARVAVGFRQELALPGAELPRHGPHAATRRLRLRRRRPHRDPHPGAAERHPLGSGRRRRPVVGQRRELGQGVPQPRGDHGLPVGHHRRRGPQRLHRLRAGERPRLRHRRRRFDARRRHQRLGRRLPQRRQRLGSARPRCRTRPSAGTSTSRRSRCRRPPAARASATSTGPPRSRTACCRRASRSTATAPAAAGRRARSAAGRPRTARGRCTSAPTTATPTGKSRTRPPCCSRSRW